MGDWLRELRFSVRLLKKEPVMLIVAVVSLALGIGVSTAVLAVARSVLVKPLPVPQPSELRLVHWSADNGSAEINQISSSDRRDPQTGRTVKSSFSYPAFEALRDAAQPSDTLFGFIPLRQVSVSIGDQPVMAGGMLVSGNFFTGLRVPLALGRGLTAEDDRPGATPAAVVSYGMWQRALGGEAAALGQTIRVNGQSFTLVGVTAPPYFGVSNGGFFPPADVTLPLHAQPVIAPRWTPRDGSLFTNDSTFWIRVMARVAGAADEAALQQRLAATFVTHPSTRPLEKPEILFRPGALGLDSLRTTFEQPLAILGGVAALVFVLACLNTAGLVLVRGVSRQRELWLRLALGASRGRVIREALIDSLALSIAGGICALAVGVWGARWLASMLAGPQRTAIAIELDWPLLITAIAISCGATLLFGLLPVLWLARVSMAPEFLRSSGVAARTPRLRSVRLLIAVQIAMAVPLVIGATLLLRTVHNLTSVNLGFAPENLVVFKLDPSFTGRDLVQSKAVLQQVVERLGETPGVRGVALLENALVSGLISNTSITLDSSEEKRILINRAGPAFFETMGMPIVTGRAFNSQDRLGSTIVGVVNETAVKETFGGSSPLGQRVRMRSTFHTAEPIEIIGVVRDSTYSSLRSQTRPTLFLPILQAADFRSASVVVRTDTTPAMIERIRHTVAEVDRDVPVTDLKTQVAQIDESIQTERTFSTLLVFFGSAALLLACVGLHGVMSYTVARRASEIGIRLALGARRRQVIWMILRQAVTLAAAGLAIGLPAAVLAGRTAGSLLFGVKPTDPWSLATGAIVIVAITVLSGTAPAMRAAELDPLTMLRSE